MLKETKDKFAALKIVDDIKKELQRVEASEKLSSIIIHNHNFDIYEGKEFIKKVYIGLLGREVDLIWEETHLKFLKDGKMSKNEIVSLLKESDEYRNINVKKIVKEVLLG